MVIRIPWDTFVLLTSNFIMYMYIYVTRVPKISLDLSFVLLLRGLAAPDDCVRFEQIEFTNSHSMVRCRQCSEAP